MSKHEYVTEPQAPVPEERAASFCPQNMSLGATAVIGACLVDGAADILGLGSSGLRETSTGVVNLGIALKLTSMTLKSQWIKNYLPNLFGDESRSEA